jgi:Tfp pilus assembly protein PilW
MRRALQSWRGWPKSEAGFTLVEALVAMMMGVIVMAGGVMVFTAAIRSEPKASARGARVQEARTTAERITRELRQGWGAPTTTSTQLAILTYVDSATCGGAPAATAIPCRVTYTCASGTCDRVEAKPDGSSPGPAEQVVTGLSNGIVFTYTLNSAGPTWIGVTLSFPSDSGGSGGGDDAITVEDGAALRNPAVSPP